MQPNDGASSNRNIRPTNNDRRSDQADSRNGFTKPSKRRNHEKKKSPNLPGFRGFKPNFAIPDIIGQPKRFQYPPSAAPIISPLGNVTQQMLDLLQTQQHPGTPLFPLGMPSIGAMYSQSFPMMNSPGFPSSMSPQTPDYSNLESMQTANPPVGVIPNSFASTNPSSASDSQHSASAGPKDGSENSTGQTNSTKISPPDSAAYNVNYAQYENVALMPQVQTPVPVPMAWPNQYGQYNQYGQRPYAVYLGVPFNPMSPFPDRQAPISIQTVANQQPQAVQPVGQKSDQEPSKQPEKVSSAGSGGTQSSSQNSYTENSQDKPAQFDTEPQQNSQENQQQQQHAKQPQPAPAQPVSTQPVPAQPVQLQPVPTPQTPQYPQYQQHPIFQTSLLQTSQPNLKPSQSQDQLLRLQQQQIRQPPQLPTNDRSKKSALPDQLNYPVFPYPPLPFSPLPAEFKTPQQLMYADPRTHAQGFDRQTGLGYAYAPTTPLTAAFQAPLSAGIDPNSAFMQASLLQNQINMQGRQSQQQQPRRQPRNQRQRHVQPNRPSTNAEDTTLVEPSTELKEVKKDVGILPEWETNSQHVSFSEPSGSVAWKPDPLDTLEPVLDFMDILPDKLFSSVANSPDLAHTELDLTNGSNPPPVPVIQETSCGPKLKTGLRRINYNYPVSTRMLSTVDSKKILFEKHHLILQRRKRTKTFKKSANKESGRTKLLLGPLVDASYEGRIICPFADCFDSIPGHEDPIQYLDHVLKKHLMAGQFICEYCYVVVSRKDALLRHIQRYHGGVRSRNLFNNKDRIALLMDTIIDGGRQVCAMTGECEPLAQSARLYTLHGAKYFLPATPPNSASGDAGRSTKRKPLEVSGA